MQINTLNGIINIDLNTISLDDISEILSEFSVETDSSVGYGQIFAQTAINAINWASLNGLYWMYSDNYDNWSNEDYINLEFDIVSDRKLVWYSLKDDNKYNISVLALVLMYGVTTVECTISGMGNDYYQYSDDEVLAMIIRYNGYNDGAINEYGPEVFKTYEVFKKYN